MVEADNRAPSRPVLTQSGLIGIRHRRD